MRGAITRHMGRFAAELTRSLGIPKACARVIEVLALTGRRLSFCEIAARVAISERSLRSHIRIMVAKGILLRKVAVTRTRRLAYEYYMAPLGDVLGLVRSELAEKMRRLHVLSTQVRATRKAVAARPESCG
jgi:predicted DNA-binding transcriptional regulator